VLLVRYRSRAFARRVQTTALPVLAGAALLVLTGCSQPTSLTIHNGYDQELLIEGLPSGQAKIDAGQLLRFEGLDRALKLVAKDAAGKELERAEFKLAGPGGESLWNAGGGACFVFGDFSLYYTAISEIPASVEVLAMITGKDRTWTSRIPVDAGPGQRLPKNRKGGGRVAALVEVPCESTVSESIAQGWLEMILPQLQPEPPQPGS